MKKSDDWKKNEKKRAKPESNKEWKKETGIYFHLSTAFRAINTYKASALGHWDILLML